MSPCRGPSRAPGAPEGARVGHCGADSFVLSGSSSAARCHQPVPSARPISFYIPGSASPGLPTSPGHLDPGAAELDSLRLDRVNHASQAPPQSRADVWLSAAVAAGTRTPVCPLALQTSSAEPQPHHNQPQALPQPLPLSPARKAKLDTPQYSCHPSLTVSQQPALPASRLKTVCAQP